HAEEYAPGGAKPMIEAGSIDDVDAVFGTHLWATIPLGVMQTSTGVFMAGADRFEIKIQGQGGHGGYPHETKDSIVDRKSTRLNSSHVSISYAVFCLNKKNCNKER